MTFATHSPSPPLNDFIERFWYYDGLGVSHQRERVLPDGTFELIFNLRGAPRQLFPRAGDGPVRHFQRSWVSGTHARYIVIDVIQDSSLIGAHFRPGGVAPFLPCPADELRDQVVDLDLLWGASAGDLRDALLEAPRPQDKFRLLERFLIARARHNLHRDPVVRHAVLRLTRHPRMARIDRLSADLGFSHKHFIDRFRTEVGLTPKRFCRIARFQEILRKLERNLPIQWADLASDCGYYDQSHFIQEFRDFSGLNPTVYVREKGEYLNFVPLPS